MKSPHLDPAWLRQKYETEGLSTYEIAAIVSRNPKRIYEKLKDFGIPTRPRGANLKGKHNSWAQPGYVPHWTGRTHTPQARAKISEAARGPKPNLRGAHNDMYGVTGEDNPNYKDGSTPERQRVYASSAWREVLRQALERDRRVCRRCGSGHSGPKSLHLHHFASWNDAPELRLALDNLVTLCRTCHEWVHSKANGGREFVAHSNPNPSSSPST